MELRNRGVKAPLTEHSPKSLEGRLAQRAHSGALRTLTGLGDGVIDLCSNDYLGFSTTGVLARRVHARVALDHEKGERAFRSGATGSRLISGHNENAHRIEALIAQFHGARGALLYSSGYAANVGLLSSLPTRHDTVIADQFVHASLIDGVRLGRPKRSYTFRHNDVEDLKGKISRATGEVYVVVESVYSMDGDFAPLVELVEVCESRGAYLIVDEAHAVGVYGPQGRGRVVELGLEDAVFARVVTFGKALGCHGAAVLGSKALCQFLVNFSRSFIYSTALDDYSLLTIEEAYGLLRTPEVSALPVFLLVNEFRQGVQRLLPECALESYSPIQGIRFSSGERAKQAEVRLREKQIAVKAILPPTVPRGGERIRVCLHTFNAPPEVQLLIQSVAEGAL